MNYKIPGPKTTPDNGGVQYEGQTWLPSQPGAIYKKRKERRKKKQKRRRTGD